MNDKAIYVVLVKAMTGLGRFARKFTKYPYTHIAVCMNDSLEEFISFSRKSHYAIFDAGFMREKRSHYAFGKHESFQAKVFRIPVSSEIYERIMEYIISIENDSEYIFNIFSMITMGIFHGVRIYKAHNCMSFTSKIIEMTETVQLNKKYHKYNIKEIDNVLSEYLFEERQYYKSETDEDYMAGNKFLKNLVLLFKLNGQLFFRFFFKRNEDKWY